MRAVRPWFLDFLFYPTQEWYNYVTLNNPIPYAKAHYRKNYVNAYWDGRSMVFGDGDGRSYYPLTGLDTAAHELGHGVTEKASNLIYRSGVDR
ncbi:peptidase [Elysia marginata]|uniref:Peptidase n=1 Tax=Elysia marginata TaxID=1093978 RepID=A0AAV4JI89_9GAST|nr:peptidase [Elysia marginata]